MRNIRIGGLMLAAACALVLNARVPDACAADAAIDKLATAHAAGWTITVEAPDNQDYPGDRCDLVAKNGSQRFRLSIHDDYSHCLFHDGPNLMAGQAADGKSVLVFMDLVRGGDGDHSARLMAVFRLDAAGLHKLGEQEFFVSGYTRQDGALTGATGRVLFAFDPLETGDSGVENEGDMFVPARLTPGCGGICLKPDLTTQQKLLTRARFARKEAAALAEARTDSDADPELIRTIGKDFRDFMDGNPTSDTPKYYMTEDVALRQGGVALELVSSATLMGKNNRYSIAHLLDGNPATTWATAFNPNTGDRSPNGLFKIVFRQPVAVSSLKFWNGLQSSRKLFLANQRVKTLRVDLVDASGARVSRTFELGDKMGSQTLDLSHEGDAVRVQALVFTVLDIYPGAKYTDLCISEMAIGY